MDRTAQYQTLEALDPRVVLEQFLQDGSKRESTQDAYRRDISHFFEWSSEAGIHPLAATPQDLNRYLRSIEANPDWASRTKSRLQTALRSLFSFVSRRWHVPSPMHDPAILRTAPAPQSADTPAPVLSFDVFDRFMAAAFADLEGGVALGVALVGVNGLKVSEVHQADVQDLLEAGNQLLLRLPRRNDSATTPLLGKVGDLARDATVGRSHGPLALNQHGRRLTVTNLRRGIQKVAGILGLDGVSAQLLRNTAGAVAARSRASSAALTEMLGIGPRQVQAFVLHAEGVEEEHAVHHVWRRLVPEPARNELLDQVDRLLADARTHPIAPIALAGAALEQHLRVLCDVHHADVKGVPSIDRYKAALLRQGLISHRVASRIEGWRDLRNDAAHGRDTVSWDEAREMARAVRAFLQSPIEASEST